MMKFLFDPRWLDRLPRTLTFWPEIGIGYYPVSESPYDEDYFEKYVGYEDTPVGRALNECRIRMVDRCTSDEVVDVGIGCGTFVKRRSALGHTTYGYDINPFAVQWLKACGVWRDVYDRQNRSISLFDVLEHIKEPARLLDQVSHFAFVSMPIYSGADHVLRSKHFRKDEHCWYFTADGLKRLFGMLGFTCQEETRDESDLGREDIGSFVFRRETWHPITSQVECTD